MNSPVPPPESPLPESAPPESAPPSSLLPPPAAAPILGSAGSNPGYQRRSGAVIAGFVMLGVLVVALVAATATLGVLYSREHDRLASTQSELRAAQAVIAGRDRTDADEAKARSIAAEYARGAASFDYRALEPWRIALTRGVTPELKAQLERTFTKMEQILGPLQWVSKAGTAVPVITEHSGSVYSVSVYIPVAATNIQAPQGRQVNVAYRITVDRNRDWLITAVSGVESATK